MAEPATPTPSQRKSILLVDDEEDVLEFISELLSQETPHRVISCRTAIQALVAASHQSFHLFILDYHLPDLNGLALHDQLQTFAHLQDLPTIMMSADEPPSLELRRRHIVLLRKPFQVLRLLAGVQTALA